ncbi:MAG TPA: rhomboid family intramembrane serine protease [Aggregatilineales bacterium]|nr:rhomboid family intramembrane serine protease [Aggregatilineales bacterium]
MIPLSDADRRPVNFPIMTLLIIVVNFVVFFLELAGGDAFVSRWSMVPAQITAGKNLITLLTSLFLHAGWEHILGNMVFLWAFGPEVEDTMGSVKYLVFYLIGGLVANFAQIVIDPGSTIPTLGASGAIAAVMGAFILAFPQDRIKTVLIIGIFVDITVIPAVILLGFWFILQFFGQIGSIAGVQNGEGVAYVAHIAGFIYGAITWRLFESAEARTDQQIPG